LHKSLTILLYAENDLSTSADVIGTERTERAILNKFGKFVNAMLSTSKNIEVQANTDEAVLHERVKDWVRYTKAAQQLVERHGESADKLNAAQIEMSKKKVQFISIFK